MSTKERIQISLLIEKMYSQKADSERLGLINKSTFRGEQIHKEEERC